MHGHIYSLSGPVKGLQWKYKCWNNVIGGTVESLCRRKKATLEAEARVCLHVVSLCGSQRTSECVWSRCSRGTGEVACSESFGGNTEGTASVKQKGSLALLLQPLLQPLLYSPSTETLISNMSLDLWHVFREIGTRADFLIFFFFLPSVLDLKCIAVL